MPMMKGLVLSLFPGIDLLGRAFEEEGFCVVRGPDVLWGGDIHNFCPPSGRFDGVIGGPPCQAFSRLRYLNPRCGLKHGNLIPEFERCVREAQPAWFLMENVPDAPEPCIAGYQTMLLVLDNRWVGGETTRRRHFSFGSRDGKRLVVDVCLFEQPLLEQSITNSASRVPVAIGGSGKRKRTLVRPPAVLAGHGDGPDSSRARGLTSRSVSEMARLQGLPEEFFAESPFGIQAQRKLLGNGVPLSMGRAVARAIKRAVVDGKE